VEIAEDVLGRHEHALVGAGPHAELAALAGFEVLPVGDVEDRHRVAGIEVFGGHRAAVEQPVHDDAGVPRRLGFEPEERHMV
jgi:hypothetical protein